MPRVAKVAALTVLLLVIWSAVFAPTFKFPFYWDDFHLIRPYTGSEIQSALHAVADPDQIETPGLRPCSILLYNLQGSLFGENVIAHRVFMAVMMGLLMVAVGTLSLELGLTFVQLTIVFSLFVFSRIFASLVLWISLSHLLLAYILIVLTAYLFVVWVRHGRWSVLGLMLVAGAFATFTREETYTLPVVLPFIWLISSFDRAHIRRVAIAAICLLAIVCFHYWLWHFLVPNALSPELGRSSLKRFFRAVMSAWFPGGFEWSGFTDIFIGRTWVISLIAIVLLFVRITLPKIRWLFLGLCCLGVLLSAPALGVARPFGIALPTLAFMSAVAIAVTQLYDQVRKQTHVQKWQYVATTGLIIIGLALGIAAGIRRATYLTESIQENSVTRTYRDGEFLFDLAGRPATIPAQRREAGLARLQRFGVRSPDDVKSLQKNAIHNPDHYRREHPAANELFLAKYDYLSF